MAQYTADTRPPPAGQQKYDIINPAPHTASRSTGFHKTYRAINFTQVSISAPTNTFAFSSV
jgi:hypothetical protein